MQLSIPNLHEAKCQLLSVCGTVESDDPIISQLLSKKTTKYYQTTTSYGLQHSRLMLGGGKKSHCHIDLATPTYFKKNGPPEHEKPIEELSTTLESLSDTTVNATAWAQFLIGVEELPGLIKITKSIVLSDSQATIAMTGGKFSVEGSAITAVNWEYLADSKTAQIELVGKFTLKFQDSYLTDALSMLSVAYRAFVATGVPFLPSSGLVTNG